MPVKNFITKSVLFFLVIPWVVTNISFYATEAAPNDSWLANADLFLFALAAPPAITGFLLGFFLIYRPAKKESPLRAKHLLVMIAIIAAVWFFATMGL